jgi:hypothetical protein
MASDYCTIKKDNERRYGTDIVRIQDPAGKTRTFTFDRGWLAIADAGPDSADGGSS